MGKIISVDVKNLPLGEFGLPTVCWGDVPLFNVQDSRLLMDYCANHGIAVLGVDSFRIDGKFRIPDLSDTSDFSELMRESGEKFAERSVAVMREFLKLMSDDVMLEFVLVKQIKLSTQSSSA